ncbi:MAG: hypothetical protein WCJ55_18925 [Chloroflexales bacterium]
MATTISNHIRRRPAASLITDATLTSAASAAAPQRATNTSRVHGASRPGRSSSNSTTS